MIDNVYHIYKKELLEKVYVKNDKKQKLNITKLQLNLKKQQMKGMKKLKKNQIFGMMLNLTLQAIK